MAFTENICFWPSRRGSSAYTAPMGPKLIEDARLLIKEGWNVIRTWQQAREIVPTPVLPPQAATAHA